ncbi:MAG: LacI family DNA-binding transcriptional regulator [Verrucomicrobiota bacterium]
MANLKQKRVSVSDVAKAAGVARATAAFALSGTASRVGLSQATVKRIEAMAKAMNYVPNKVARSLISSRSEVIGVLLAGLWGKYAQKVVEGVREVLDGKGYVPMVTIHSWEEAREKHELDLLMQMRADAIIIQPQPSSRAELYKTVVANNVPLVFLGDAPGDMPHAHAVVWDGRAAAHRALDYLVSKGRRRIGFIGQQYPFHYNQARFRGYREFLQAHKLPENGRWEIWEEMAGGLPEAMVELFASKKGRPDAFLAMNDTCALDAAAWLIEHGIGVPEEVAIVGLGDCTETVDSTAFITSVREPLHEMGREAAMLALDLIDHSPKKAVRRILPGDELVERRSS